MELRAVIENRHSYRLFTGEPVPREQLEALVAAARAAPSAGNKQPARLDIVSGASRAVVDDAMEDTMVYLSDYLKVLGSEQAYIDHATRFATSLGNAPVVIVVSVPRPEEGMPMVNTYISAGAAIENLLLAATDAGLAACNVTFSYWVRDKLARELAIPEDHEIVSLIALGYAAERAAAPPHDAQVAVWHD